MSVNQNIFIKRLRSLGDNSKVVAKNTIYAFLIKGGALVITFFSTPFYIRYFNNNEVLGLWFTLLSVLSWFLSFDLGVGNGIRNHLVRALALNDRKDARNIISSGCISVCAISIVMAIAGGFLIATANLNVFFNIPASLIPSSILKESAILVFISVVMRFMLTTVSSIFYALQKASVNNLLALCVSILQFIYILIFKFDNPAEGLRIISWVYLFICNLPIITAGAIVFGRELKDCQPNLAFFSKSGVKRIMGVGILFFLGQIFYLIIANTNEWFISHFWNPEFTADYGFYYRITMLPAMMVSLGLSPTWSMVTKAATEKNYVWLNKLYKMSKRIGILIIALQFMLIPFLQFIMNIWLGKGVLEVSWHAAVAFACFGAAFVYSSMLATIVSGLTRIGLQLWCYGIGAGLKIAFIIFISKFSSDWTWVVWSNVFVLAPYCIIQQFDLNRLMKKTLSIT